MSTRRSATAPLAAYVLHRYDWSESSLILDLYTREQGRIAVAAKGAKRPYSQLRSVLLPLQRLQVSLGRAPRGEAGEGTESASEIYSLRGADYGGGAPMPGGAALFAGFYLNELLMKLLARYDPHPTLFDAYAATLPTLTAAADEVATESALRAFELTLLREVGLLPDLSVETSTQQSVAAAARYTLLPDVGIVPARGEAPALTGHHFVTLQAALDHGSIAALQSVCVPVLPALKGMLRTLLHYHLGSPTLRTRELMLEVRALTGSPTQAREPR